MPHSTAILQVLHHHTLFTQDEILELTPLVEQGYCNQNYLLRTQNNRYILRVFGTEDRDRALEYQIQTEAYRLGIAPQTYCLDTEQTYMISEYIQGKHKTTLSSGNLHSLAQQLRLLHSIEIDTPPTILAIPNTESTPVAQFSHEPVLCHNDLNPQNLLWRETDLMLIDWEYAGSNDRYFDLASVVVEFGLGELERGILMEAYFQPILWDREKLETYTRLYREVCQQWWDSRTPK